MVWCDIKPHIVAWDYECLQIPYMCSIDKTQHRYIIDFLIDVDEKRDGNLTRYLIEVKPLSQILPPDIKKCRTKKSYNEKLYVYTINRDKRLAAEAVCRQKGWKYKVITEKDIFNNS